MSEHSRRGRAADDLDAAACANVCTIRNLRLPMRAHELLHDAIITGGGNSTRNFSLCFFDSDASDHALVAISERLVSLRNGA
jgi:hypothetical protein